MVFALGALADSLGLDLLLGGFVAGSDRARRAEGTRGGGARVEAHRGRLRLPDPLLLRGERHQVRPRRALTSDPIRLLELPLFLALFLVVRGTPALLLYRGVLDRRDRVALAFFSATGLPLIVAITTIAVEEGHMRSPPPPPWSAPASCRRRSSPSSACGCEPGPPRTRRLCQPSRDQPLGASGDLTPDAVQVDSRQLHLGQDCARPAVPHQYGIGQEIARHQQHRRSVVFAGEQRAQIDA